MELDKLCNKCPHIKPAQILSILVNQSYLGDFLSQNNGSGRGHLCHTDTFLVPICIRIIITITSELVNVPNEASMTMCL